MIEGEAELASFDGQNHSNLLRQGERDPGKSAAPAKLPAAAEEGITRNQGIADQDEEIVLAGDAYLCWLCLSMES